MNCETAQRMMESNDPGLEEHRRTCQSCAIRAHAPYYEAPPDLAAKIRRELRSEVAPAGSRWRWLAIAACVLLGASLSWNVVLMRSRVGGQQVVEADVLSAHIRSLAGTHLLDVPSSDRHTVKPWFAGKVDFAPGVKEVEGFPLAGGRLEYFDGRPAAALVYGRRSHVINLFTWPQASGAEGVARYTRNGYHIETWWSGGMAFWVVSDLEESELHQFVSSYRQN